MKTIKSVLFILILIALACNNNQNVNTNNNETNLKDSVPIAETTPESIVQAFVYALGAEKYQEAYNYTSNPKWKSYEKFSSKSAFGGINGTVIYDYSNAGMEGDMAKVIADILYTDPVNGDNRFKQEFRLQKTGNDWKIVDLKVLEKIKDSAFAEFLNEFSALSLPYPGENQKITEKAISQDLLDKYIIPYNEISDGIEIRSAGKFNISDKYVGLFIRFHDQMADFQYLYIFDNDGHYQSSLESGYEYSNAGNGMMKFSKIDASYHIITQINEYTTNENEDSPSENTEMENYSIIKGMITKKNK
jgi:hypothetical protein